MAPRHLLPSASPVQVESPPPLSPPRWAAEEWEEWEDPPDALPPSLRAYSQPRQEFKVSITSPAGRIPLFRAWQQAIWNDTEAEVDDQPLNMESKLRAILSLRGTRTIDVVGAIIDPRPALIFQLIGRPITLRLRRDETGIAPQMASGAALPPDFDVIKLYSLVVENVHTAVMFCDLWDTLHPALQHPDVSHPSLTQSKQRLRRVVLNLSFDPSTLFIPPDLNDAEFPLSVHEVVLVFRAVPGHRPRGAVRAEPDDIARYLDLLFETIGFYIRDMAHTIVNVTDLNPAWGGSEGADWITLIREKIRRDLALRSPEREREAPDDLLQRQLRFLSLDEFRHEVGEEQFRIETVEELDKQP
ncbi:hypothetical protein CC85DRAFT_292979 [Cutaneotrichosporon oleaginosum]|uniref:Uncharacterized protein n=1 Tax=Cutaneotrichosporon oleaginosum TaxID=879819 RepID=A0A0J1AZT3_9TREE|nr:uncharacterized protein CC85DRAFT_292979 [Cutaneotrichosporon oleaginosum]KLT40859.1 hypothetical protein CC85DRAFT_292979 [Cutaneotrichosporon oleaginosum]TXT09281.1 hypothetical protein COLE_03215 [Cutaneotrichosporon oleaginosum]